MEPSNLCLKRVLQPLKKITSQADVVEVNVPKKVMKAINFEIRK